MRLEECGNAGHGLIDHLLPAPPHTKQHGQRGAGSPPRGFGAGSAVPSVPPGQRAAQHATTRQSPCCPEDTHPPRLPCSDHPFVALRAPRRPRVTASNERLTRGSAPRPAFSLSPQRGSLRSKEQLPRLVGWCSDQAVVVGGVDAEGCLLDGQRSETRRREGRVYLLDGGAAQFDLHRRACLGSVHEAVALPESAQVSQQSGCRGGTRGRSLRVTSHWPGLEYGMEIQGCPASDLPTRGLIWVG